jgi:hypothetical protein
MCATDPPGASVSSTIWRFTSVLRYCFFAAGSALGEEIVSISAGMDVPIYSGAVKKSICLD